MADRVSTCIWRVDPQLLVALDDRFGDPVDAYVNGSQVWLREDGPGGIGIEWRLHPVPGYRRPKGLATDEVLETIVYAIRANEPLPVALESLWDGLEAFPCDGDEIEPVPLAAALTEQLGRGPDAFGVVDHDTVGDRWEAALGESGASAVSVTELILAQLQT
jgi:hypothetical protein